MDKPHIVILGAGPAGLAAAYQLTRRGRARVTVLERNSAVGGNAGSFEIAGVHVDYGSHRLHPACDPEVLKDIRTILGDDLLDRPRHGRIRLRGRWIHFPLKPLDLALRLPPSFAAGVGVDLIRKLSPRKNGSPDAATFASVLEHGLGQTICRDFYFPYARKIWGVEPDKLSAVQAKRRVGSNSLSKMAYKIIAALPGLKPKGSGRFFYPRRGYGQISDGLLGAAQAAGARVLLGAKVNAVEAKGGVVSAVCFEQNREPTSLQADAVWSTIPLTILAQILQPSPPFELLNAASHMCYRAMILIYLVIEQSRFSEYDAHYFPGAEISITRLSEPKNYSNTSEPADVTVLCAELPCTIDEPVWNATDEDLKRLVCHSLDVAGIPIKSSIRQVITRRLRQAYPVYQQDYHVHFDKLDDWLSHINGLLSFGRQGLFAHDNTHHAMYMAYCATDCLGSDGQFNSDRWQEYRRVFETHVVED